MRKVLAIFLIIAPVSVLGQGQPEYGLSNSVVVMEDTPEIRQRLDQQAESGAPEKSELSAQSFVDSQERIAETFRRPIPEKLAEPPRGDD